MKAENLYLQQANAKKSVKGNSIMPVLFFVSLFFICVPAKAQTITTFAGNHLPGYTGDNGPATAAKIASPIGVGVDGSGNVYIGGFGTGVVRKVNTSGVISSFAGNGTAGNTGDGGPATAALIGSALGIAFDGLGNVYISDEAYNVIRKVNVSGIISTVAGTGTGGFNGDNIQATAAKLAAPSGIAVDGAGNLYIADQSNSRIRKVDVSGIITTIAGTGVAGFTADGIAATASELNNPIGVAVDGLGNVFIADGNNRVRKVSTSGIITTFAGTGANGYTGDGGPATAATFQGVSDVILDNAGNMYIADFNNNVVRKVYTSGIIRTVAGNGTSGYTGNGGPATAAELSGPSGLARDSKGGLYIADYYNNVVRAVIDSPFFVNGSPQTLAVCENASATDISSLLTVNDWSTTTTLTWSQFAAPSHGALVAAYAVTANGDNNTPTGITYTPAAGYSGTDAFTIQAADGFGRIAYTTINVTVNPTPTVVPTADQTICNGASSTAVTFTGTGTSYTWTNSNSSIGLASTGSGNISSFSATDTSASAAVTGMVIVTPKANGCTGPTDTFNIRVNPTPNVTPSSNQTQCNGTSTTAVTFTGSVPGTVYSWTNTNSSIGLASTGTGNISAFTATDTTPDPISGIITVMTTANGCSGTSNSFTITVEPTPMLSSSLTATVCNNTTFTYEPSSLTGGTSFSWSRDSVAGISNPANNDDGSIEETLVNTTVNPVAVTYVYTLNANDCSNTQNLVVTVNPTPVLTSTHTPAAICDSTLFTYASTSATTGTTYTWSRDTVAGISNPAGSGADTIMEVLINTTANPLIVMYVDTLMANGCRNVDTISVTVNPKPVLIPPTSFAAICDSTLFTYVPASATTGTTFTWSRAAIAGNPAASGVDTIRAILVNTGTNPIVVTYIDTLKANGCINTQPITITVNPQPKLNSAVIPPGICDSAIFNYTPMTLTLGTTFAWVRPFVLGIDKAAGSGITGNPDEQLINTTNDILYVTYIYTLTANGCSNTQNVVEAVYPTPLLSSSLTPSVCSGSVFNYATASYAFGTTFIWNRAKVAGISPATGTGTGNISETLTDSLLTPINTIYNIRLTANGCSHMENITLTVKPAPPVVDITTYPPSALCSNTMYQNFGAASVPPAGQNYHWTATNATVWATGSDKQYCLVNFNAPGTAVVTLQSNLNGVGCITNSSYTVNVGPDVSDAPQQIIYFNGQLVCLESDEASFQWGYDDATTLDSTIIPGEINPNYFISAPDLTYRYYWVITTHNGCMQKSYYNPPTGITNISTGANTVKVYPNPANDFVNIEIQTTAGGNYEAEIVNILGQKLNNSKLTDHKAKIDIAGMPAGCYLVNCYRDGTRIATSRFIKN